jgi:Fe-S-cluster containining protein
VSDQDTSQEKDFLATVLLEEARSAIWKTQARMEPRDLIDRVLPELREITSDIDLGNPEQDAVVWRKIGDLLIRSAYETRSYCIRCGVCCKNHAPTLLMDDMVLLNKNIIRPEHLFTVRKGEPGYCNFNDETVELESEMIKVKSKTGSNTCIFFQGFDRSCSIYENRPSQCRTQECWAGESTLPMQALMSRKDIFERIEPLWKIICAHEKRCNHDEWKRGLSRLEATRGHSVEELLAILRYDQTVREFIGERFGMDEEIIELVVGRPIESFLSFHGLELLHASDGTRMLKPIEVS